MGNYNEEARELEQQQKRKRKHLFKLANNAYIIEKEVSVIMKEVEKLDIGSSSDMIRFREYLVRELTKLKKEEGGL